MASRLTAWLLVGLAGGALAPMAACGGSETTPEPEPEVEPEPEPEPVLAPTLGLNDVSVLLPLPASPAAPGYLGPLSEGSRGPLLAQEDYDQIPGFPVKPSQGLDYDRMRVISVRFDGCFPAPSGCQAQIRMVMQPITEDGATLDSALHLFYLLTDAELAEVTAELRRLRTLAPEVADAPLDVHASLVAQGMQGAYGTALTELLLKYTGRDNFIRMTFFLRAPPVNEVWFFGGFDRVDGQLVPIEIHGVGEIQRVIHTEVEGGWTYQVDPAGLDPEDGSTFYSSAVADTATPEDLDATFASYLRVENPDLYGPDELPCAGCHFSAFVTAQARMRFGLEDASFPDAVYTSSHDLTLAGGATHEPSSLRAFGYFDREPMIAMRVVNESAAVCDDLELRFPPGPLEPVESDAAP